jgi:hypothetical protein
VQADVEGVPQAGEVIGDGQRVELHGAAFRMADRIGLMPLLRFASAQARGLDSNDMEGMAALHDMIRDCIDEGEWERFVRHATDTKAEADELMAVVKQVIEALTARPTPPPRGSSPGRRTASANSKASSRSPAIRRPQMTGMVPVDDLVDPST